MDDQPAAPTKISLATYLWAAALSAALGFAAVYVTMRGDDNVAGESAAVLGEGPASPGPAALPSGPGANPLSKGEMAAFVFKKTPEPPPAVSFVNGEGAPISLADWKGKVVLLNLWATWCAPCREEMPALDRLQKELGGDKFEVVALAVDRTGIDGAKKFLNEIKIGALKLYADPTARAGTALRVVGMPTTLLVGADGREIGRLVGPAKWDSADAKALVRTALGQTN